MPESIASTGAPACVGSRAVFSLHPAVLRSVHPGSRPGAGGPTGGRNPGSGPVLIDAGMMRAAPNLTVIGRAGVGYDTVDVPEASRRGIPVVYTPGHGLGRGGAHPLIDAGRRQEPPPLAPRASGRGVEKTAIGGGTWTCEGPRWESSGTAASAGRSGGSWRLSIAGFW